jgi:peptidoglycan hydrolase-like protein with peptidoglycan-binding domain
MPVQPAAPRRHTTSGHAAQAQPQLGRGSVGPAVEQLQLRLHRRGITPGPLDGIFGPKTEAAVRAFQRKAGLEVDGQVGPKTWALLLAAPSHTATPADATRRKADAQGNALIEARLASGPLLPGDADKATAFAKRLLRLAGHDAGTGVGMDARAVSAVRTFQQARGLPVTGEVDRGTFDALTQVQRRVRRSRGENFGRGQAGEAVLRAEQRLAHLGYDTGKVDGVFDADTAQAVKAYRKDVSAKGRSSSELLTGGVRQGLRGRVKAEEKLLRDVGFKQVKADGVVDARTTAALRAFEKKHGLKVDGELGAKDLQQLKAEAARAGGGARAFAVAKKYLGWNAAQLKASGNAVGRAMFDWVPNNVNCANFVSGVLVAAGQLRRDQVNASVHGLQGVLDRDPQFRRVGALKNARPGDVVSMKTPGSAHVVMFAGWRDGRPLFIGSNNVNADGSQRISWTQPGYPVVSIHRYVG